MLSRVAFLVFMFVFTVGLTCAVVCSEESADFRDDHESECTDCVSTHFVPSTKGADDHAPERHISASCAPAILIGQQLALSIERHCDLPIRLIQTMHPRLSTVLRI